MTGRRDKESEPPEVEVTDAMMEAGMSAYYTFDRRFEDADSLVLSVYEAMWRASLEPDP